MNPRRRWLAVGAAQAALAAGAAWLCAVPTEHNYPLGGTATVKYGQYTRLRGYPVPWREERQDWAWAAGRPAPDPSPPEYIGCNPLIPVLLVALAVCAPPAATAPVSRGSAPRGARLSRLAV